MSRVKCLLPKRVGMEWCEGWPLSRITPSTIIKAEGMDDPPVRNAVSKSINKGGKGEETRFDLTICARLMKQR